MTITTYAADRVTPIHHEVDRVNAQVWRDHEGSWRWSLFIGAADGAAVRNSGVVPGGRGARTEAIASVRSWLVDHLGEAGRGVAVKGEPRKF